MGQFAPSRHLFFLKLSKMPLFAMIGPSSNYFRIGFSFESVLLHDVLLVAQLVNIVFFTFFVLLVKYFVSLTVINFSPLGAKLLFAYF